MRGEWIEMGHAGNAIDSSLSLPMRGEWIEMAQIWRGVVCAGLSPCGESGLKSALREGCGGEGVSPHAGRVD